MVNLLEMAGHIGITLIAVVTLALRIEHRLTKIETDVAWLKERQNPGLNPVRRGLPGEMGQTINRISNGVKGDCKDEGNSKVDKA